MESIKIFFTNNLRQFKAAFLATSVIVAIFIVALLTFGSTKYSLFDTITLPLGLGAFLGLVVTFTIILIGYINWLYKEYYLKTHLKLFIDNQLFAIYPHSKSVWEMTMPALYGNLNSQEMIIELIEQKDLLISFVTDNISVNNKKGFIYRYKNFKNSGVETLYNELIFMTIPIEDIKKHEHKEL